jgi:hypothetical protein
MRYVSVLGGLFTLIELTCYIAFFHYVFKHDNHVAVAIVPAAVIKQERY